MNNVCGDATANEVKNFISILAENKRLALLPELRAQFELFKAQPGGKSVDVEVGVCFRAERCDCRKAGECAAQAN